MANLKITEAQNGKSVTARIGDTIALQLGENPTTGYQWAIKQIDPSILVQQRDEYQSSSNMPGSSGTRTIVFRAAAQGITTIALTNERSWEPANPANQQFSVTIDVQSQ